MQLFEANDGDRLALTHLDHDAPGAVAADRRALDPGMSIQTSEHEVWRDVPHAFAGLNVRELEDVGVGDPQISLDFDLREDEVRMRLDPRPGMRRGKDNSGREQDAGQAPGHCASGDGKAR